MYTQGRTDAETVYRKNIERFFSNRRPHHLLCWDLDGVLEKDGNINPRAREVLSGFGSQWNHIVTTASGEDHALPLLRGLDGLLEGVFCNLGKGGRKAYASAVGEFSRTPSVVVIGNEPTDVPLDISPDVFVYGSLVENVKAVLQWLETLGMGDLVLGYHAGRKSSKFPVPAVFGDILGVRTVCIE